MANCCFPALIRLRCCLLQLSQATQYNAYIKQQAHLQYEDAVRELKERNQARVDTAKGAFDEAHQRWMQVGDATQPLLLSPPTGIPSGFTVLVIAIGCPHRSQASYLSPPAPYPPSLPQLYEDAFAEWQQQKASLEAQRAEALIALNQSSRPSSRARRPPQSLGRGPPGLPRPGHPPHPSRERRLRPSLEGPRRTTRPRQRHPHRPARPRRWPGRYPPPRDRPPLVPARRYAPLLAGTTASWRHSRSPRRIPAWDKGRCWGSTRRSRL